MSELPLNREAIDRPLSALRGSGTVFGVMFYQGTSPVFNETSFSANRIEDLGKTLDDIFFYFVNEGRDIDQLSFGFDGGNLLIVADQDYRLVVLHSLNDEVDFIAKAARAFLIDYQMGIFAAELNDKGAEVAAAIASGEDPREEIKTEEVATIDIAEVESAAKAAEDSAATGPIRPILDRPQSEPLPEEDEEPSNPITVVPPAEKGSAQITEEELEDKTHRAVLAADQPESTLPPPRKPKIRR